MGTSARAASTLLSRASPASPAIAAARPGEVPELWRQSLTAARHLSALPVRATREIVGAAGHTFRRLLASPLHALERPHAPSTSFNRDVGAQRGYVFGTLPLADVKEVKNHFGVTVNDVVLAVGAGSLRPYLIARGQLPDEPLRTSIAVSLRTDADDTFSNQLTTAGVSLATDLGDPAARLQAIAADARQAKERARSGGTSLFEVLSMLPPALVGTVLSLTPADLVREEIEKTLEARGATAQFDVVSNPEFLKEGAAVEDFMKPDRVVVGVESDRARQLMERLYRPLNLIQAPILFTSPETAELIKYATNSFLATKVTFINEMADLCERVGADVQSLAKGLGLDRRRRFRLRVAEPVLLAAGGMMHARTGQRD